MTDTVSLIGMPGAGKSTVGVLLAKYLGLNFVDTDLLIQVRHQATLQQLIDSFDVSTGDFSTQPLEEIITQRLSRLPDEARTLLEMVAVFGQPVAAREAAQLAGLANEPYTTLTRMRNEKLVRLLGGGESQQIDTVHDKIRETVLATLGEKQTTHQT